MLNKYKQQYAILLQSLIPEFTVDELFALIEMAPDNIEGDLAFPCFRLSKSRKENPNNIARKLGSELIKDFSEIPGRSQKWQSVNVWEILNAWQLFCDFVVVGGYVNAKLKSAILIENILNEVLKKKDNFGRGEDKWKTILLESPGPNTNKPLHLGHVRNLLLGNTIENVLKFAGYDAKRVDIMNDRGIHICKSMLAYKLFGENAEPNKKTDHFVGDRYVKYAKEAKLDPDLDIQARKMLIQREEGDKDTLNLWKKMNTWAIWWISKTYKRYGTKIDKAYFESDYYLKWKKKVLEALENWIFKKNEKRDIIFCSENEHLGEKVVLRADGTSIYSTNDIGIVQWRFDDFKMDAMVYIVASEQADYFKVLFEIFEALWYSFAKNCLHLSYGMISLPSWKMKSREWTVVEADNLADEMQDEAKKILKERSPDLDEDEVNKRSEAIAMSAIKFFIMRYDVGKNFVFDPKESLSFEGDTGPYLQYTFARANNLLKHGIENGLTLYSSDFVFENKYEINELEHKICLKLSEFPWIVKKSAMEYKPNLIARFVLDLARLFNHYYQEHKILQWDPLVQNIRIKYIEAVGQVMQNWLNLMGIDIIDEM